MAEQPIPEDIVALAEERAAARSVRDWALADELKGRLEAAGWRIVDAGTDYSLAPARSPDVVEAGVTYFGAVQSIPSRHDEPDAVAATIVVMATAGASADAALSALAEHQQPGGQVLAVASRDVLIEAPADEIVRTVEPFSPGEALQAALRRAVGRIIVVLDPGVQPTGDVVTPLSTVLQDPSVAVAGIEGLRSVDLRRYQPAGPGDVTALRSGCFAFRRADGIASGPIDDRLHLAGSVATWWSLALRDRGPDVEPRRALALELPVRRAHDPVLPDDHARLARRDVYRIADRYRGHDWLATAEKEVPGVPGDRADGHDQDDGPDHEGDTTEP